ncbi:MAG TPA: hypothetical protein VLE53_15940 [Gemmatimonadaceae bacterium]|nr:hypothetical protein [Gemmatimonadaceae bacterium]
MPSTTPLEATIRVVDGITVREHPGDAFARAPRLVVDSAPVSTIGGAAGDPAYDLTCARDVVLLDDGRVVVTNVIGD